MLDIFLGRLPSPADHAGDHAGDALRRGYQWAYRELRCMDGASVPVHGDVHFGNTLADAEQLHCLIDWEFAHAGHAAEDLAFCRGHVERIVPWSEFMNRYLAAGGRPVSDAQLQYFQVWSYLRNLTLATSVLEDIRAGKVNDLQNMVIALDARPRLETLLLQALPSIQRHAPEAVAQFCNK
jgi:aminoglycoside phosphotransferase (APT) family kinase protein